MEAVPESTIEQATVSIGESEFAKLAKAGVNMSALETAIKLVNSYALNATGDVAEPEAAFNAYMSLDEMGDDSENVAFCTYCDFRAGQILRAYHDGGGHIETLYFEDRSEAFQAGYGDVDEDDSEFQNGLEAGEDLWNESPAYRRGFWCGS